MASSEPMHDAVLIAELNDLLQLDHDAVEAYTIAIDVVRTARYRERLVEFRADHKRHIEALADCVRTRGGLPTEMPHPTAPLKLTVQALGAVPGDRALLLAFKAVEGQARDKYRRFATHPYPEQIAAVVRAGAEDEQRHYAWVEATLRELGAGEGTLQHGAASVLEGVHKILADPIEAIERGVMRAIGTMVGTTESRGGSEAPSPADVAAAARQTPAAAERVVSDSMQMGEGSAARSDGTPRVDAARFIAALRALEETGDVERIVSLFDVDAEVSNPREPVPLRGHHGARHFWEAYLDAFDEVHSEFASVVERDGTAMLEWTSTGRLRGGKPVSYNGVSVLEMRDGRVTRFRAYFDPAQLEVQVADLPQARQPSVDSMPAADSRALDIGGGIGA